MLNKYLFFLPFFIFPYNFLAATENPKYCIHDLSTLASEKSEAMKISNEGKVFGIVHTDKRPSFFIWDDQEGIKIFPFPLQDAKIKMINNNGQAIIKYKKETGWIFTSKVKEYFFWDPPNDQFFKIIPPKWWENEFMVISLNDKGQFVIVNRDSKERNTEQLAAYWDGFSFHKIDKKIMDTIIKITNEGKLFGYSEQKLDNGDRTVASIYHLENQEVTYHPFFSIFQNDKPYKPIFKVLYTDNGIIAGFRHYRCRCCPPSPTYISNSKDMTAPHRIEGFRIESINSKGQGIGLKKGEEVYLQPAYWSGKELFDINKICPQDKESPWEKIYAVRDINDQGQIVGIGKTKEGKFHAILLTPDLTHNME